jgi:hypothetical protein
VNDPPLRHGPNQTVRPKSYIEAREHNWVRSRVPSESLQVAFMLSEQTRGKGVKRCEY